MKINGKEFRQVSCHFKKSIAEDRANAERKKGRLARIRIGQSSQGKKAWEVWSAPSGGRRSKRTGQTKIGGYGAKVLKPSGRQTGKSSEGRDEARKAAQPGKRRSESGNIYYENRRNRSDLRGQRV